MRDRTSRRAAGVQCLDQYFLREYESASWESRSGGKHDEPGHPHHKDERQNYKGDKADTNEGYSGVRDVTWSLSFPTASRYKKDGLFAKGLSYHT